MEDAAADGVVVEEAEVEAEVEAETEAEVEPVAPLVAPVTTSLPKIAGAPDAADENRRAPARRALAVVLYAAPPAPTPRAPFVDFARARPVVARGRCRCPGET